MKYKYSSRIYKFIKFAMFQEKNYKYIKSIKEEKCTI